MKEFYQLFGGYGKDPLKVYQTYFHSGTWGGNGYWEALLIAFLIAVVGVVVFYYVVGRKSFKMSTFASWVITGIIVMFLTFVVTNLNTGMQSQGKVKYGLQSALDKQWEKNSYGLDNESDQYKTYQKSQRDLKQTFKKGVFNTKPVFSLCLTNCFVGGLLFVLISIPARKGPTLYCKGIPLK